VLGDIGEDVGQPGLRVYVVHLGADDQAVHHRGALSAPIGPGEEPGLATKGDAAQAALGGVVREADASIIEEPGKYRPALQHVVHCPSGSSLDQGIEAVLQSSSAIEGLVQWRGYRNVVFDIPLNCKLRFRCGNDILELSI